MVLDMEPADVLKRFPNYYKRRDTGGIRGLHIQEVMDVLIDFGYSCTIIEDKAFFEDDTEVIFHDARFWNHVANSKGVLVGINPFGRCHATANSYGTILDPAINKLKIEYFQYWRIDRIRSD